MRHVTEYSPAGEYLRIFPNFENCACSEKDLKDNKDNSLRLGQKYALIFVLGHYLFLIAHSFPRATLLENCALLGTDNVRGQISMHIFGPNGGYCLFNTLDQHLDQQVLKQNLSGQWVNSDSAVLCMSTDRFMH